MTVPPYTGRTNSQNTPHQRSAIDTSHLDAHTPTPISSHRHTDFTLSDIQFLAESFDIIDMEHAESTTSTRIWIPQRPGKHTALPTLRDLEEKQMTIHRGDFIRAAYRLPDGTKRIIWEHRVFDDDTPIALPPQKALVEAQAANWDSIPALETPSQQYLTNHD